MSDRTPAGWYGYARDDDYRDDYARDRTARHGAGAGAGGDRDNGADWLGHEGASVFSRPPAPPAQRPGGDPRAVGWPPLDPWETRPAASPATERTAVYGDLGSTWGSTWNPPPSGAYSGDPGGTAGVGWRTRPEPRGRLGADAWPPGGGEAAGWGRTGEGPGGDGFRSPAGFGAVIGIGGAAAFLAALLILPWFATTAGDDVTLADIRQAYDIPATDPGDLPGAGGETPSTLPDGIPTPADIAGIAEEEARDAATETAAGAIDDGKMRYLEFYTNTLWMPVAAVVAIAAVVSTLLAPRSTAVGMLLGVRRLAGALVVPAAGAHAAALWIVFTGDGAPTPATGVWIGVGGLAATLVGCIIGPRR